jgi:hypothetical protein
MYQVLLATVAATLEKKGQALAPAPSSLVFISVPAFGAPCGGVIIVSMEMGRGERVIARAHAFARNSQL